MTPALVPSKQIRQQLVSVLRAWGMSEAHADTTADMMLETDLRGVDSHGISMLPSYDREFRAGRLNMRPVFKTVREGPAMALIDADASLGHPVSVHAMNLACDKARGSIAMKKWPMLCGSDGPCVRLRIGENEAPGRAPPRMCTITARP